MSYEYMSGMGTVPANYLGIGTSQVRADLMRQEDLAWDAKNMDDLGSCSSPIGGFKTFHSRVDLGQHGCTKTGVRLKQRAGGNRMTGVSYRRYDQFCCPSTAKQTVAAEDQAYFEKRKALAESRRLAMMQTMAQQPAFVPVHTGMTTSSQPLPWEMDIQQPVSQCPEGTIKTVHHTQLQARASELSECTKLPERSDRSNTAYCCPVFPQVEPSDDGTTVTNGNGTAVVTNGNGIQPANGNGTTVTNGNGTAVVTNGNGEAAVVPVEETKYFGFTTKQLMLMGAGGLIIYMLAKK